MTGTGITHRPYDFFSENFLAYVSKLIDDMTPDQRAAIPLRISKKAVLKDGFKAERLNFADLMYLLITTFNRQAVIIVSGNSNDADVQTLDTLKDAMQMQRRKIPQHVISEKLQLNAMFVIGDKQLMEAAAYASLVSHSKLWRSTLLNAYTYPKVGRGSGFREFREAYRMMVAVLAKYESSKSILITNYSLTHSEWFALLFFSKGEEKASVFKAVYKAVPGGSNMALKKAVSRLVRIGYLMSRGTSHTARYSLTAKGEEVLQKLMENVFIQPVKHLYKS